MTSSGRSLWRDRRGVAALEFALILPLMVILFMGTIEVTQLIRVKLKLSLAAQAIQTMVASQNSVTTAIINNDFAGGQLMMTPFSGSALTVQVASVTFNSAQTANSVVWQVLENGATSMTAKTACGLVSGLSLGSDSVILVQATYVYRPVLSYILPATFQLTQVAFGRPRNASSVSGVSSAGAASGPC